MAATEQQLSDAVRQLIDIANKGSIKDDSAIWKLMANPDEFILVDGFGPKFGKAAVQNVINDWVDNRLLQIDIESIKVTLNWIPGFHMVAAKSMYKFGKPIFDGFPSEFGGILYVTADDNGKLLRIHSQNLDPKIDQQLVDGVLDLLGGKVPEGGDLASKMAAKMVATVGTRSADKLVEDMADDALFADPIGIYNGKAASHAAVVLWFGAGLQGAKAQAPVISLEPNTASVRVDYDFGLLPAGAPVANKTHGSLFIVTDAKSGKITRVAAIPYDDENREYTRQLIGWLGSQAGTKPAA